MDVLKKTFFITHLLSKRQINWEIISNFVAFLENLSFDSKYVKDTTMFLGSKKIARASSVDFHT